MFILIGLHIRSVLILIWEAAADFHYLKWLPHRDIAFAASLSLLLASNYSDFPLHCCFYIFAPIPPCYLLCRHTSSLTSHRKVVSPQEYIGRHPVVV